MWVATYGFVLFAKVGGEVGLSYRAAVFYVTNSGKGSTVLINVQVQVLEGDSWRTISDKPIDVVPVITPATNAIKRRAFMAILISTERIRC